MIRALHLYKLNKEMVKNRRGKVGTVIRQRAYLIERLQFFMAMKIQVKTAYSC